VALLLVAAGAGCRERPRVAPPGSAAVGVAAPASAPAPTSGLRAYRDPVTGAFTPPPAPAPGAAPQRAAPAAAPPVLTEIASPGGGTMVRLQGAFTSDVRATLGAHGADVSCATAAAR
jgi:hypothetical protein